MQIKLPKDLIVYQKAYALAMKIFEVSKSFPAEEKYSLTDQIRRSSRSVCTNLRLDFACECGYLAKPDHAELSGECREIGAMLGSMANNPSSFLLTSDR
jgi:hypothetical protein